MAVGVYFRFQGATTDQYEQVCRGINNGELMTKLSDWPGGGCLAHSAWQEGDSLAVYDVWESPESFQAFGEQLMPLLAEAGMPAAEPHVVPLHNFVAS